MKFFRKLRYSLIGGDKTRKYLKYAIGEVILVVIGILIALSINNWNEARKLASIELDILQGIKQNILMDTVDLNHNRRRFKEMNERDTIVISHLMRKAPLGVTVESNLTDIWRSNITLTLHSSYFDEAKTKGLSIISNKVLRDSISRLYEFKYPLVLYVENGAKQYDYLTLYEELMSNYLYIDAQTGIRIGEEHYQTILNDELFTWKLWSANLKMRSVAEYYEDAHKAALDVVEQIDKEITKR